MSKAAVRTAMVFAAGLGKRMQPLTMHTPKPLIEVGGRSMLDRALDRLADAGVELAVVNSHHLASQVHEAIDARRRAGCGPDVVLSHEPTLLETGGGLIKALGALGSDPFFSLNADVVWLDGSEPALVRLGRGFDASRMDALLLLHDRTRAVGYQGPGDFALAEDGHVVRADEPLRPLVFTGLQVWHPRALAGRKAEPFSLGEIYWSRRGEDGVLRGVYGMEHDGQWLHVGRPQDLPVAERALSLHEQHPPA